MDGPSVRPPTRFVLRLDDSHRPRGAVRLRLDAIGSGPHGDRRARGEVRESSPIPPGRAGVERLRALAHEGSCRYASPGGPRLRWVAPRPGQLVWRIASSGARSLHIRVDDPHAIVLPLVPPCAVDPTTGAIGEIETGVAPELLTQLVASRARPLWAPAAARDVGEERPITVKRHRAAVPTPKLTLFASGSAAPQAVLTFVYGGVEVEPAGQGAYAARLEGDVLHQVHRDRAAEADAALALVREGGDLAIDGTRVRLRLRSEAAWLDFSRLVVPRLRLAGWTVEIEESWSWQAAEPERWYVDVVDEDGAEAGAWFSMELGVEIDGERVNVLPAVLRAIACGDLERHRLRAPDEPFVLVLPDRRILVPAARLQPMIDVLVELSGERALPHGRVRLDRLGAAGLLDFEDFVWTGDAELRALAERLATLRAPPVAPPPTGLRASLRPYQLHGLGWLRALADAGLGGILADDMGLGKTVQALAHVLGEIERGRTRAPSLVVAPRSVLHNWAREAERFTPALRVAIYHGPERALDVSADLVVTTHALLQRDRALRDRAWHAVVLDEAQAIKNPRTKVAAAARQLRATQRLCLTGTPMENDLSELWSLVHFVAPGLLGSPGAFGRAFRTPIERDGNRLRMAALSRRIAPFMLRRTKAAVLSELPPKTEIVRHAVLEGEQRDLYESVRLTMQTRVRDELARRGLAQSRVFVLNALLKLRQVCCHPPLVRTDTAARVGESAKLELLHALLAELRAEGRSVLVFSQFTSMLDVIAAELRNRGIAYLQITGQTRRRQEIVDRFQAGETGVMLVSLKAGGTGLNLTAADTVIHYDPWWNPAVERQATDRAHRIGQTRPVTVYRLVCEGTVEERMLALHERKRALALALEEGAQRRSVAGLSLDEADLAALLAPS